MKNNWFLMLLFSLLVITSYADPADLGPKADSILLSRITTIVGVNKLVDRTDLHVALLEQYPRGMKYDTILASIASRLGNLSQDSQMQYVLTLEKGVIAFSVVRRINDQQKKLVIVWRFDENRFLSGVNDSLELSSIEAPKPGALIMPGN